MIIHEREQIQNTMSTDLTRGFLILPHLLSTSRRENSVTYTDGKVSPKLPGQRNSRTTGILEINNNFDKNMGFVGDWSPNLKEKLSRTLAPAGIFSRWGEARSTRGGLVRGSRCRGSWGAGEVFILLKINEKFTTFDNFDRKFASFHNVNGILPFFKEFQFYRIGENLLRNL